MRLDFTIGLADKMICEKVLTGVHCVPTQYDFDLIIRIQL